MNTTRSNLILAIIIALILIATTGCSHEVTKEDFYRNKDRLQPVSTETLKVLKEQLTTVLEENGIVVQDLFIRLPIKSGEFEVSELFVLTAEDQVLHYLVTDKVGTQVFYNMLMDETIAQVPKEFIIRTNDLYRLYGYQDSAVPELIPIPAEDFFKFAKYELEDNSIVIY